jgi:hypothetical protein
MIRKAFIEMLEYFSSKGYLAISLINKLIKEKK